MSNTLKQWPISAHYEWVQPLSLRAHSRGGENSSGHYGYEIGPGALFEGAFEVKAMGAEEALDFRGFISSLRGKSGSFYSRVPVVTPNTPDPCTAITTGKTHATDCTTASDGTTADDDYYPCACAVGVIAAPIAAQANVFELPSAMVASGAVIPGAFLLLGAQLLRVVSVSGLNVTVAPRVRSAYGVGTRIDAGAVFGLFRLDQDTPIIPLDGFKSSPLTIKIAEVY